MDTCTSVTSTQNQTDNATRTVLPEAATVTDLDTSTCACTGGSSHVDTVHRGNEALSNCPAPADTSEQSASKADPAIDGNSSESSDRNKGSVAGFDLAKLCDNVRIPQSKHDEAIMLGIPQHPKHFPVDKTGTEFPVTVLRHTSRNGESCIRDYFSWSEQLQALFCFPFRLFSTNDSLIKSSLASPRGWSANCGPKWKKLYDHLTEHKNSASHQQCYLSWRDVQRSLTNESAVDMMLDSQILQNRDHWRTILNRLIHVVFFLSERGLPFRGDSCRIGDKHNGLFPGVLQVIASYDSTLKGHLDKVRLSQEDNTRQQVHYLSPVTKRIHKTVQ